MASPILALDLKDIMNPPAQWKQYLLPGTRQILNALNAFKEGK